MLGGIASKYVTVVFLFAKEVERDEEDVCTLQRSKLTLNVHPYKRRGYYLESQNPCCSTQRLACLLRTHQHTTAKEPSYFRSVSDSPQE